MTRFQLILTDLCASLFDPKWDRKRKRVPWRNAVLPICGYVLLSSLTNPYVSRAGVVYNNTSEPHVMTLAGEVGDTVTLAGTERYVTSISIGVLCVGNNPVGDDYFQMRLWTADGPGGTVGTLLWQSTSLDIPLSGPLQLITFNAPLVHVPDTLIWDVSHTESSSVAFQWSNPVTVGSSPDYAWTYLTRKVQPFPFDGTPANFMARIEAVAVPEPSALVFFGLVVMMHRKAMYFRKGASASPS